MDFTRFIFIGFNLFYRKTFFLQSEYNLTALKLNINVLYHKYHIYEVYLTIKNLN